MLPVMADRLLGREQDAAADEDRNDQRGADAAEVESVVREWLGEQVSHRRAQRTNEDEGQPEQQGARNPRAEVGGRDERQRAGEDDSRPFVNQPRIVREKVAESKSGRFMCHCVLLFELLVP
jgi:hypothetical protein